MTMTAITQAMSIVFVALGLLSSVIRRGYTMFEWIARIFAFLFFGGWGLLVLDDLWQDAAYNGPSGKNRWPAIYSLSLISVGIGFLTLP